MDQYLNSCRVCLCFIKKDTKPQDIKLFFEKLTRFPILPDEPQTCCSFCYTELVNCVRFIEKCERTQNVLDDARKGVLVENETTAVEDYPQILNDEMKEETKTEWEEIFLDKLEEKSLKLIKNQKFKKSKSQKSKSPDSKVIKVICPYCGNLVKSSYLENHIKCVHTEPRNSYSCDICHTNLSSKKSVIRHMTHVHLKMQKYKCKICKMEFPNETLRKAHLLQIHQVLPPKTCPFCDYRAFTKAHITRHIQRHRGDRRFKCQICNFAFVTLLQLQTHQAVHSDARNYECDECQKRFKTKKNLSAHKKCHLAYEYECDVCKKAFLTNQMMRNHVTKNHPEYDLPPRGTVMNKEAVKRMKNIEAEILLCKLEH